MFFFVYLFDDKRISTLYISGYICEVLRACEIGTSSNIFGNARKSSENGRKYLEVAGTFSEVAVMTRRKSHSFDSEKVGRYRKSKR